MKTELKIAVISTLLGAASIGVCVAAIHQSQLRERAAVRIAYEMSKTMADLDKHCFDMPDPALPDSVPAHDQVCRVVDLDNMAFSVDELIEVVSK